MRGILLVIPIGDAILYAEPVFLKPETLEFPELRRIILADTRQVVMQQTLETSVAALTGEGPAVAPVAEAAIPQPEEAAAQPAGGRGELVDQIREELRAMVERLEALLNRLESGDS